MLGFERRVAVRFLREGRMQSVLIIVGVAAGVAVVAYISALITGLQTNTLEKTLGAQAHVTLSPLDDRVIAARPHRPRPRPWCRPSRAHSGPVRCRTGRPCCRRWKPCPK
jgi:ABC-type lipoprotein release transport system permease subunit